MAPGYTISAQVWESSNVLATEVTNPRPLATKLNGSIAKSGWITMASGKPKQYVLNPEYIGGLTSAIYANEDRLKILVGS